MKAKEERKIVFEMRIEKFVENILKNGELENKTKIRILEFDRQFSSRQQQLRKAKIESFSVRNPQMGSLHADILWL